MDSRRLSALSACVGCVLLLALPAVASAAPHPTSPPKPAPTTFGPSLSESPTTGPGSEPSDTGYWNAQVAPVGGFITGIKIHGNSITGTSPQPGGEIFHISVLEGLGSAKFQVATTSDPHFVLSHTTGTYHFAVGRPATNFPMPIKAGQFVSFNTSGGTYNVFGNSPGSTLTYTAGGGQSQAQGANWTGTPFPNTVVQMQVTETPTIKTTHLDRATSDLNGALADEQAAIGASKSKAVGRMKHARGLLTAALGEASSAKHGGEISTSTFKWLKIPLSSALAFDKQSIRPHVARKTQVKALHFARKETKISLADIRTAVRLADRAVR